MSQDLMRRFACRLLAVLSLGIATPGWADEPNGIRGHLRIRLGIPQVVRGPGEDGGDTSITFLRRSDGTFNAYNSNQTTRRIRTPNLTTGLGGPQRTVIPKNVLGSGPTAADACGSWLNATHKAGTTWYALVHNEGPCDYSIVNTYETMSVWQSTDEGDTWTPVTNRAGRGTILAAPASPYVRQRGRIAGEGDFTWVPGPSPDPDGSGRQYMYAYGGRYYPEWGMVIARAPIDDLGPGQWRKYLNGAFGSPGVGGDDSLLTAWKGVRAARVPGVANVVLLGQDHVQYEGKDLKGLTLAFSDDMINFQVLREPLLPYDAQVFNERPAPSDLYVYPIFNNDEDGSRVLHPNHFNLYYTWVPPNRGLDQRYLVVTPVQMSIEKTPQSPQVGVTLERYYNPTTHVIYTTAAPVRPELGYKPDAFLGYVMTAPPSTGATAIKLEECRRNVADTVDYMISVDGTCAREGFTRTRSVGWLFEAAGPDTTPIYSCLDQNGYEHYLSNLSDCERHGRALALLGHALAR